MKLAVGFITYKELTAKYLPFFLPSLKEALSLVEAKFSHDYSCQILAVDNSVTFDNENIVYIKNNFPEVKLTVAPENLGFSRAYNLMIEDAFKSGAEYFLMINPDTILDVDSILKLIISLEDNIDYGAVTPRLLRWDFINNIKTDVIDSDGLEINAGFRARDRHQGLKISDVAISSGPVFGFTGAAVLIRMTALQGVAFAVNGKKQYLDELMFMYKEDVDLSWRLRLDGWEIFLDLDALVYHDRTGAGAKGIWEKIKNRIYKSKNLKAWSFLNQQIIFLKYINLPWSAGLKIKARLWQVRDLIFLAVFEPSRGKQFFQLLSLKSQINLRASDLRLRIRTKNNLKNVEKWLKK
jgi:GT2 family glycosyltransferase